MKRTFRAIGPGLKITSSALVIVGFAFAIGVGVFVENGVLHRQSRTPDPALGYTVTHDLKGATFYVTPDEDRLMDISTIAFFAAFMTALVLFIIDRIGTPDTDDE